MHRICGDIVMGEPVEGGATLAWRLLATLEGGTLLLATSAILAYTARNKLIRQRRRRRPVKNVIVTNTKTELGKELKNKLESRGCVVTTLSGEANNNEAGTVTSGATSGAGGVFDKADALVIVGVDRESTDLNGLADSVTRDVYENMSILEKAQDLVHTDGYIAWGCAGAARGAFRDSSDAFDTVLHATLRHVAHTCDLEAVWVGRCEEAANAAEQIVSALFPAITPRPSRYSLRNAAHKISGRLGRWLKIIT